MCLLLKCLGESLFPFLYRRVHLKHSKHSHFRLEVILASNLSRFFAVLRIFLTLRVPKVNHLGQHALLDLPAETVCLLGVPGPSPEDLHLDVVLQKHVCIPLFLSIPGTAMLGRFHTAERKRLVFLESLLGGKPQEDHVQCP